MKFNNNQNWMKMKQHPLSFERHDSMAFINQQQRNENHLWGNQWIIIKMNALKPIHNRIIYNVLATQKSKKVDFSLGKFIVATINNADTFWNDFSVIAIDVALGSVGLYWPQSNRIQTTNNFVFWSHKRYALSYKSFSDKKVCWKNWTGKSKT